jgi:23S rRNA pseudouridine2605 synthase
MSKPPSRPSAPRGLAKPPRIRWDNKPRRKSSGASAAPSKGALEKADGEARIAKLLARAGVASRREVERMIADKRITLNDEIVETPAMVLKNLDGVAVDGKLVDKPAPTMLYLFHKPEGCLTAERDFSGRKTIYDLLPPELPRVMPIGRLDLNTEGLLLLTNDGEFKRQMELPSTGVERTYRARCFGNISQAELEELIHGIEVDGVRYGKIDANMERRTGANVWIEMTLTEGKNREVRRVLEHLGLEVNRLIRTRYGPFVLGNMPTGEVAEIRKVDLIEFRNGLKRQKTAENPS